MRVIILLALIGAAYAVPKNFKSLRNSNRIIGGEVATIERYPFMATMLLHSEIGILQYCGGTLVSSKAVVSAAHCYEDDPRPIFTLRLGTIFALKGGTEHTISKIIMHEDYNTDLLTHDIAVIQLTVPAVISDQINIARIAGPNYILPDDTVVYAAGWGETGNGQSDVLRHVAINVINHKICTDRYALLRLFPLLRHTPEVTPEMLCTGILNVGGKDACQGDSGGPIIHNGDILVGVTSWGHRCATRFFPGVSARVSSYTDWIYTNSIS